MGILFYKQSALIYVLIIQRLFNFTNGFISSNYTHKVNITIQIDNQFRTDLLIGLYGNESPKAVLNFIQQCTGSNEKMNKEIFTFNKKPIYKIYKDQYMQFGDYEEPKKKGNYTIYNGTYYSEINDFHTELGALAQERVEENGHVGSEYTIMFNRASFDGRSSLWHVFGSVFQGLDFLKYLSFTAGENDGVPIRKVKIYKCSVL